MSETHKFLQDIEVPNITTTGTISASSILIGGESVETLVTSVDGLSGGELIGDLSSTGNITATEFYGDGSNLTGITDNFVTSVDGLSGGEIIGDVTLTNLEVVGDLTVDGITTTINTQEVLVEDNILTLNSNLSSAPLSTLESGIQVNRGTETDYQFLFRESDETFVIGVSGDVQPVATRQDTPIDGGISVWNDTEKRFDSTITANISAGAFYGDGSNLTGTRSTVDGVTIQEVIADGSKNTSTTRFNDGDTVGNAYPNSASSSESGWSINAPFNGAIAPSNSAWQSSENQSMPQWISITNTMIVNKYRFNTASSTYGPVDWEIQGRIGAGSFVTLDSRSGETTVSGWTQYYTFENSTAYDDYRLYVTAVDPGSPFDTIRLNEWELITAKDGLTVDDLSSISTDIGTSGNISGSAFYGDGSNLSGLTPSPVQSYTDTTVGDNASTDIVITHSLATEDVYVVVKDNSTKDLIDVAVRSTSTNAVTLYFSEAPTTNQYTVRVIG